MRNLLRTVVLVFVICNACGLPGSNSDEGKGSTRSSSSLSVDASFAFDSIKRDQTVNKDTASAIIGEVINTKNVEPEELTRFAETLMGVPYLYGSTDPKKGFDCSGFITYVFNHFAISVPRSSIDFTNVGKEVPVAYAERGDLILFTGTDSTERLVGHMGIVVSNSDTLKFIHSTSGKANGVTITPLNEYYQRRFVKIIRVFAQNDQNRK